MWGNGAPRGWPGITPAMLDEAIPYGSFWIPASAFCQAAETDDTDPADIRDIQMCSYPQKKTCIVFPDSDPPRQVHFTFASKSNEFNATDLQFIFHPLFFQTADSSAPSPTEVVQFEFGLARFGYDDDMCVEIDYLENMAYMRSNVLDAYHLAYGHSASGNEYGARQLQGSIQGTSPSGTNMNLWDVSFRRSSADVQDTYDNTIYCIGILCQYATNFANIAQWPNVPG